MRDIAEDARNGEKDLDSMTKAELMYYAEEHGIECKPAMSKAEILAACKGELD